MRVILARLRSSEDAAGAQVHQRGNWLYINQRALMLCAGIKSFPRARFTGVALPIESVQIFPRLERIVRCAKSGA